MLSKLSAETFSPDYHNQINQTVCAYIFPQFPRTSSQVKKKGYEEYSQFNLYEERNMEYSDGIKDYLKGEQDQNNNSSLSNRKRKRGRTIDSLDTNNDNNNDNIKSSEASYNKTDNINIIKFAEEIGNKNQKNINLNKNLLNLNKNEVSKVEKEEKNGHDIYFPCPAHTLNDCINDYNSPNSSSLAVKMSNLYGKESGDVETKALSNDTNKNTKINTDINNKQNTQNIINDSEKLNDNNNLNKKDKFNEVENKGRLNLKSEDEKQNNTSDNNTEIITEKNVKEKDSHKSSETKKQDIIKIKFITTKNLKLDSNNSNCSETEAKEKLNKPYSNLKNINLNQGQTENCGEINEKGTNIIAKEKQKEGNIITYEQDFLKIPKKIREDNNIVKIKKKFIDNTFKKINSEIDKINETLNDKEKISKLEKYNPDIVGIINSEDNMKLYEMKMKDVIIYVSEKANKKNGEKDKEEPDNKNKQIIAELEQKYNEESEVRKLLKMKFSEYLKRFIEDKEDWNKFIEESKKDQKDFYIQKKYKKVIDDMRENHNNKDLEEIKKYIFFRELNADGKEQKKNGNLKEIERDKFKYYYYKIKDEKGFKNYIKSMQEYKNLKFDYEDYTQEEKDKDDEKKNIDAYIDSLRYLAKNYYEFFKKRQQRAEEKAKKKIE